MKFIRFWLPFIIWTIMIIITSSIPNFSVEITEFEYEDKIAHLLIYLIFAILFLRASTNTYSTFSIKKIVGLTLLISISFATIEEYKQKFIPGRNFEVIDIVCDYIGIFLAQLIFKQLLKI